MVLNATGILSRFGDDGTDGVGIALIQDDILQCGFRVIFYPHDLMLVEFGENLQDRTPVIVLLIISIQRGDVVYFQHAHHAFRTLHIAVHPKQ